MTAFLLSVFILALLIQLYYWIGIYSRLAFYQQTTDNSDQSDDPVSIIICAKNEANNLKDHLPFILDQQYAEYEVIVVNDHSTDRSQNILNQLKARYNQLIGIHLTDVSTNRPGKKLALKEGIQQAKYDWVLLTDADCRPISPFWLQKMMQGRGGQAVVLGYGPLKTSSGWVNQWARFETIMTAIQYFSWALHNKPYMGVGRNLLYKKALFRYEQVVPEVTSGDDDLFIQSLTNAKVSIQINPETFMYSESKPKWRQYFRQKWRHVSSSWHYNLPSQIRLAIFAGTQILFWILFVPVLYFYPLLSVVLIAVKWISQWIIFRAVAVKLEGKDLVPIFPLLDIGLAFYYCILSIGMWLPKKDPW